MRIESILQRRMGGDLEGIHSTRLKAIFAATAALMRAGKATLTAIGRAIAAGTAHKHGIKRVDRLLGNQHLAAEGVQIYSAIARRVVPPKSRPVVIVDWTDFSEKMWALVAAVSLEGRAVVIYSEVHPISRYLKPAVHKNFLKKLRQVLPESCTPIVLTDAGFRTPWIREVSNLGWDYVCRVRGRTRIRETGRSRWSKLIHLFERIAKGAHDFGIYEVGLKALFRTRIIGFSKRRRRTGCWKEKWGKLSRTNEHKQLRSANEPWVLATSLKSSPDKTVALYRRRMQIEETFRDTKSGNFGFALEHARTRSTERADNLVLLASLAHLLSIVGGLIAESFDLASGFQANSVRNRRVLSLSRLGRLLFNSQHCDRVTHHAASAAWATFSERVETYSSPPI